MFNTNNEAVLASWESSLLEPRESKSKNRCMFCDKILYGRAYEINGAIICQECADETYGSGMIDGEAFCASCGERVYEEDSPKKIWNRFLCEACFDDLFGLAFEEW